METIDAWQRALTQPVQQFVAENLLLIAVLVVLCAAGLFLTQRDKLLPMFDGGSDGDSAESGSDGGDGD